MHRTIYNAWHRAGQTRQPEESAPHGRTAADVRCRRAARRARLRRAAHRWRSAPARRLRRRRPLPAAALQDAPRGHRQLGGGAARPGRGPLGRRCVPAHRPAGAESAAATPADRKRRYATVLEPVDHHRQNRRPRQNDRGDAVPGLPAAGGGGHRRHGPWPPSARAAESARHRRGRRTGQGHRRPRCDVVRGAGSGLRRGRAPGRANRRDPSPGRKPANATCRR